MASSEGGLTTQALLGLLSDGVNLQTIEEIEIIFNTITDIGDSLSKCVSLRKLTLLDTGLKRISGLEPVAHSLQLLCLTEQKLTHIDPVVLPQLRELYLQQNEM